MRSTEPEFASVESFVEFLLDDERDTFSPGEAQKVAANTKSSLSQIIEELKGFGLGIALNKVQSKNVRGICSHSHGTHPFGGGNSTFTTPGGSNIMGFAGRQGS
jgi:hypothetical protein